MSQYHKEADRDLARGLEGGTDYRLVISVIPLHDSAGSPRHPAELNHIALCEGQVVYDQFTP